MAERSTEALFWDIETGRSRLTLEAFEEQVHSFLEYITELCQMLYLSAPPFSSDERSIPPGQIKEVRRSLKEMSKPVQELIWLLHDTDRLPVIYTALCYRLLAVVNIVQDQISRFLACLHTYQVAGISSSEGEKWLRSEIYSLFEQLVQYNNMLSERVKVVSDEAKEQERKLLSLYENYPNWKGR